MSNTERISAYALLFGIANGTVGFLSLLLFPETTANFWNGWNLPLWQAQTMWFGIAAIGVASFVRLDLAAVYKDGDASE